MPLCRGCFIKHVGAATYYMHEAVSGNSGRLAMAVGALDAFVYDVVEAFDTDSVASLSPLLGTAVEVRRLLSNLDPADLEGMLTAAGTLQELAKLAEIYEPGEEWLEKLARFSNFSLK